MKEQWFCRYDQVHADVKFVFSKIGPVQFVRAFMKSRGKWKPVFFSGEHPVLEYEQGQIKDKYDPQFESLRQLAMEIIEDRLRDYQKVRGVVGLDVDDKKQFRDLEELAHEFVPWQIDKVVRTGDVERGAVQTLMTQQGAEVMAKHRVSPKLRRELADATKFRRDLVGRKLFNGRK